MSIAPAPPPERAGLPHYALGVLALAVAYTLSARLGLAFTSNAYVSLIWPPSGIALAALYRAGLRYWPGVAAGAFLGVVGAMPAGLAVGAAVGNTLGPVVAVAALRRLRFDPSLASVGDLSKLVAAGAVVGMAVPATCGVALFWLAGAMPPDGAGWTWVAWYLRDVAGVLLVAPMVLTVRGYTLREGRRREAAATLGWLAVMFVCSAFAFTNLLPGGLRAPAVFAPFLVLLVVGVVSRTQVGMLHALVLAAVAVWGTTLGEGPFGDYENPDTRALMVWTTMVFTALGVLVLTTLTAQRNEVVRQLAAAVGDYQALVEDNPALICRFAGDGTIRYANETLERFFAHSGRLVGRKVCEFVRQDSLDATLAREADRKPLRVSELVHPGPLGDRTVRWAVREVRHADGSLTELHAVGLDVTAERFAEGERRAIERKLLESQRLEAIGVLAGGVAHDFNNLLTGILGHAEMAAGLLPSGHPARAHLATVTAGAGRAGGLTRQLLAYAGRGRFVTRSVSLNDLIRQTADLLRVSVSKKVDVRLDLAADLPAVTADESQLHQVVMNLVINAGEAIGEGSGTVTVSTAVRDVGPDEAAATPPSSAPAPGRYVVLTISDTGHGMDEATKARLFDPFYTTKLAGRGLGLSAVMGIVRSHNGAIRVHSRLGVGSQFVVMIPAGPAAAPSGVAEFTPVPPDRPPPPPGSRGLALVADDEPAVRRVGALMLEQLGYEVVQVENGREAVEAFSARPDDVRLILLDLTMPVMGGAEALAEIRTQRPAVPVVLCSGYTEEALPEVVGQAPATAFLSKPFNRGELRRAVATAVGS